METLSADFLSIISLINLNLKWIGLGFDPEVGPRRINTFVIVLGSALYMLFIVHCLSETSDLGTASQMIYHIPWMLQYNLKSANMYLQYPLGRDFICWARDTMSAVHPVPAVDTVMQETNSKCLKIGKSIVR